MQTRQINKCKLVKIESLSGYKASVYSVMLNEESETLLEKFFRENKNLFLSETKDILKRLKNIGLKTGARKQFLKEFEGKPGDGVCALYDNPDSKLRLYCIVFGTQILVVGGGGPKPKNISAFQDDEKLMAENYFLRWLSAQIAQRIKNKEITYDNDYLDFSGNLEFHHKGE